MNPQSMTEGNRQDKRKISCGGMRYTPRQTLLPALCPPLLQKPSARRQQRYMPQLGPKALEIKHAIQIHNTIFIFAICHGWQVIFFFFFHIIHTIQKEILQYMVIPKFCSRSHLFHHVYLACFPILHKMEINSVSGRSFIFQTKTKTKNLLKQIPAFHRTPGFPGFAILKTKISRTALKQAGLL